MKNSSNTYLLRFFFPSELSGVLHKVFIEKSQLQRDKISLNLIPLSHKYLFIHFSMYRLVNISLVLSRIFFFLWKKFYSTRWGNWLWGKKLFWKACAALNRGNYMNVEWLFFSFFTTRQNFVFFFLEKLFIFILPCTSRLYMSTLWRNNDDKVT